jgi:cyanophycinase
MPPRRLLFASLLAIVACARPPEPAPTPGDEPDDGPEDTAPDAPADPRPPGPVVLAGGGAEGDADDAAAWSSRLYPHLWDAGDVTGDGVVTVAILSTAAETDWLPNALVALGADAAFNLQVASRAAADDDALSTLFSDVDAVFLKGGDQGAYYDLWNDTVLDELLHEVHAVRGGGIGGTSAGAMSMAEFAFAGGQDLITTDVLEDARSALLDDRDGGSGVHADFLGAVPGYVIDTHFTQRARLGRLAGILAQAADEHGAAVLGGLGCEEQTGVWIRDGRATVVGVGAVTLLRPDAAHPPLRDEGVPLTWTHLRLDRLTEGWSIDLATGAVDEEAPPDDAEATAWDGRGTTDDATWYADGDRPRHEERFAWVQARAPWSERPGADTPVLADAIGAMDAFSTDRRAAAEEALFRGLHDHIGATGLFLGRGASAERLDDRPDVIALVDNPAVSDPPSAALVVDTAAVRWRSLSPSPSIVDAGDGSLHAAGFVGARLHVLYTPASGLAWDTVAREVVSLQAP